MTRQQGIVKGRALQKIGRAVLIIAAIGIVLGGLLMLPADDLSLYASHPNPAAEFSKLSWDGDRNVDTTGRSITLVSHCGQCDWVWLPIILKVWP